MSAIDADAVAQSVKASLLYAKYATAVDNFSAYEFLLRRGEDAARAKEEAKAALKNPPKSEVFTAYQKRIGDIQKRLVELKGTEVTSLEVRQLIGEYDYVARQLYQVQDAKPLMMDMAKGYQEGEEVIRGVDSVMGDGASHFMGEAIEAFYTRES